MLGPVTDDRRGPMTGAHPPPSLRGQFKYTVQSPNSCVPAPPPPGHPGPQLVFPPEAPDSYSATVMNSFLSLTDSYFATVMNSFFSLTDRS